MNSELFRKCCLNCEHRTLDDMWWTLKRTPSERLICKVSGDDIGPKDHDTLAYVLKVNYAATKYECDVVINRKFTAPDECPYKLEMMMQEQEKLTFMERARARLLEWLFS